MSSLYAMVSCTAQLLASPPINPPRDKRVFTKLSAKIDCGGEAYRRDGGYYRAAMGNKKLRRTYYCRTSKEYCRARECIMDPARPSPPTECARIYLPSSEHSSRRDRRDRRDWRALARIRRVIRDRARSRRTYRRIGSSSAPNAFRVFAKLLFQQHVKYIPPAESCLLCGARAIRARVTKITRQEQ